MIYKKLLITQANEIAQLLNEYVISHNKMLQSAGTFKSLFTSTDFPTMYKGIGKVKTNFERKARELKEIKAEYYGNFADVSMEFFDTLESYFEALFDTVKQLHLLIFRLYETSKGIINNKRKLSWSEYSQLTKTYDDKVKGYADLGDKLNRVYQSLEGEPDDFIDDEGTETNTGFIQIPLLLIIIASALLSSIGTGLFIYQSNKLSSKNNNASVTAPIITESVKEQNPSPTVTSETVLGSKSDTFYSPTPLPSATPVPTKDVQKPKIDSAVGIEQCRTYAKEKRKEEERKINEEYARSEPAIVELAAAQTNSETEAAALKYGKITQSQVVRRTEVFEKLISDGVPIDQAGKIADDAGNDYSIYLRSLHDWAVSELNKWYAVIKNRFDTYENQVYQSCLSSL